MKQLLYFGPIGQAGHYFWDENQKCLGYKCRFRGVNERITDHFDGTFTPVETAAGKFLESVIPPMRIVAWWDYSVDSRGGSNSALIGFGYDSAEQMLDDAVTKFPDVMNRQPRPTPV